jgi:hypothetical protein
LRKATTAAGGADRLCHYRGEAHSPSQIIDRREHLIGSRSNRQQTREQKVKERRAQKQEKKEAAAAGRRARLADDTGLAHPSHDETDNGGGQKTCERPQSTAITRGSGELPRRRVTTP